MAAASGTKTRRGRGGAHPRRRIPDDVRAHVRISDYSDLELMETLADLGGANDDVDVAEIAHRLFGAAVLRDDDVAVYANRCVGSRMGWMGRFGFVERGDLGWKLSPGGVALLRSRVGPQAARAIARAGESSVLRLAELVGDRVRKTGDVGFRAMERQLRFSVAKRKRGE